MINYQVTLLALASNCIGAAFCIEWFGFPTFTPFRKAFSVVGVLSALAIEYYIVLTVLQ